MPQQNRPLVIEVPDTYHHTGVNAHDETMTFARLTGVEQKGQFVLLFEWDLPEKGEPFLDLQVSWPGAPGGPSASAHRDAARARAAMLDCVAAESLPRYLRPEGEIRPTTRFLIAEPAGDAVVRLIARIDTDNDNYLRLAQQKLAGRPEGPNPFARTVTVRAYRKPAAGEARAAGAASYRQFEVVPTPAALMPPHPGFVALDLGSTTTTVVELRGDHVGDVSDAEKDGCGSVATAVRVTAYRKASPPVRRTANGPVETPIARAAALVGNKAMVLPGAGEVILGAKRLLADPNLDATFEVMLPEGKVSLPKRLPAELFVAELLKRFHSRNKRYVARLAVTCPTTFSDREQAQLKRVVYDAWRRAMGYGSLKRDPADMKRRLPLVIDEASAAAYFFVYKDFVDVPGGLRAFHYLYPAGMNLLLYDCGGGTTDVSLVQARCVPGEEEVRRLEVKVLGRTGLRGFGGDDVTAAVFCLLRAKLACALQPRGARASVAYPENPADVVAFLADPAAAAAVASLVPLDFDPRRVDDDAQRRRMDATLDAWAWAEKFKARLAADGPVGCEHLLGPLADFLASLHPDRKAEDVLRLMAGVRLSRADVDEVVRGEVERSVQKANHVLDARLPADQEVHRVYVVGNASRYPLVCETIRKSLRRVRSLEGEGGRLVFDEANLKYAVAKGAVLALRHQQQTAGMRSVFDNQLTERLPYDVTFYDLGIGRERELYHEHTPYKDLQAVRMLGANVGDDEQTREVTLRRRWVGDREGEAFLGFEFPAPLVGPLELSYQQPQYSPDEALDDADARQQPRFVLKDLGGAGGVADGKEKAEGLCVSPPQQGTVTCLKGGRRG